MAPRTDPQKLEYIAGLCRRNALHVVRLAWTTHPHIGFDSAGVRWLDRYIADARRGLNAELADEFVQFMGCFYGECLMEQFGGTWSRSGDQLGIRTPHLGVTFPFVAVARHVDEGPTASVAVAFHAAIDHLTAAA